MKYIALVIGIVALTACFNHTDVEKAPVGYSSKSAKGEIIEAPPKKGDPLDRPWMDIPTPFNPPAITEVNFPM